MFIPLQRENFVKLDGLNQPGESGEIISCQAGDTFFSLDITEPGPVLS